MQSIDKAFVPVVMIIFSGIISVRASHSLPQQFLLRKGLQVRYHIPRPRVFMYGTAPGDNPCRTVLSRGNKTFRPQDVSPLVVSPLVVLPPFCPPSRFAPPTLVVSPPNHSPYFFLYIYIKDLLTPCETERKGEREKNVLWMKMLIWNYDKYYQFWSIPLITLFIWFDSLITQLMRLMMRCENTRSLQS